MCYLSLGWTSLHIGLGIDLGLWLELGLGLGLGLVVALCGVVQKPRPKFSTKFTFSTEHKGVKCYICVDYIYRFSCILSVYLRPSVNVV